MNRRTFLKASCGVSGLLLCHYPDLLASINSKDKAIVRFGMVTDLHYDNRERNSQSFNKFDEAINTFNKRDLNFVIELGDFKDQGENPNRVQTLTFLDEIETEYKKYKGDRYHVLGNHDMDSLSKADFLTHTTNSGKANGKNYYSFVKKGIKFIALDANYNYDSTDYDKNNYDYKKTLIPDHEIVWLKKELDSKYPIVVFVHQMLDFFSKISDRNTYIKNAAEIIDLFERSQKVLAVFQGHNHAGDYNFRNGIHYLTLNGMIEGHFPENNSFAIVEIDKDLNISIDGFHNCEDKYLKYKYK
jgi:alkaline phosphatase